jgi:hypothetical protein
MRTLIPMFLFTTACTSSAVPEAPGPTTVRDRLAVPTKLLVSAPQSAGSVVARRYTPDGWQEGTTAIAIDNGELDASVDATGQLEVAMFAISAQPIAIPDSVFGKPAQLRDVRLTLAGHPAFMTTWSDDDVGHATATIDLDLAWTIVIGTSATPLGTQRLHGIPLDIGLAGTGDEVDATIGAHADGEVWSWANLVQLANLELVIAATTAY